MNFEELMGCDEEFKKFMKETHDYSNELLDLLDEKNSPIVFPAIVMTVVKLCYVMANEKEKEFLAQIEDAKQGMDSLTADFVDQLRARKNPH
jgi:hypothetical protein